MDIEEELIDRFGDVPEPVENLMRIAQLRGVTRRLGVSHLFLRPDGVHLRLDERHMPEPDQLFEGHHQSGRAAALRCGQKAGAGALRAESVPRGSGGYGNPCDDEGSRRIVRPAGETKRASRAEKSLTESSCFKFQMEGKTGALCTCNLAAFVLSFI